jgi:hypothetical protein
MQSCGTLTCFVSHPRCHRGRCAPMGTVWQVSRARAVHHQQPRSKQGPPVPAVQYVAQASNTFLWSSLGNDAPAPNPPLLIPTPPPLSAAPHIVHCPLQIPPEWLARFNFSDDETVCQAQTPYIFPGRYGGVCGLVPGVHVQWTNLQGGSKRCGWVSHPQPHSNQLHLLRLLCLHLLRSETPHSSPPPPAHPTRQHCGRLPVPQPVQRHGGPAGRDHWQHHWGAEDQGSVGRHPDGGVQVGACTASHAHPPVRPHIPGCD